MLPRRPTDTTWSSSHHESKSAAVGVGTSRSTDCDQEVWLGVQRREKKKKERCALMDLENQHCIMGSKRIKAFSDVLDHSSGWLFFFVVTVCVCEQEGRREMIGNGLLVFGRLCEHIMLF